MGGYWSYYSYWTVMYCGSTGYSVSETVALSAYRDVGVVGVVRGGVCIAVT